MIDAHQMRTEIIRPALQAINLWSADAEELLMFIGFTESHLGTYIVQKPSRIAKGIFQCEDATYLDIITNYLTYHSGLKNSILSSLGLMKFPKPDALIWNLWLASMMCRVHFLRVKEPIPDAKDIIGLGLFWKKFYNSALGAGNAEEAIINYQAFLDEQK
jgi:hypothetical protein